MIKKLTLLFAVVAVLSGCGETTHDKAYYDDHPKERDAKLEQCSNDAKADMTADCQNAHKSYSVGKPGHGTAFKKPDDDFKM